MGHGDESGTTNGHQTWSFISYSSVWPFCRSHCVHPPGYGGTFSLPSCPSAALVSS